MSTTVFVSGATGFIAQHIVKLLLENNHKVVGSVRSAKKGEELTSSIKNAGLSADNFTFEVVEDIAAKGAFDEALKKHPQVTVFLHTASPFHFDVKDIKKDLIDPAVEGTTNALNAIKEYGSSVKKVVVTSSYATVSGFGELVTPGKTVDETSWNPITHEQALKDPMAGYIGSKKFAEKTVWDFIEQNKPQWQVSIINPVYVFGPQAFEVKDKSKLNTSNEIINSILKAGKDKDQPQQFAGYFIDVRDVAKAEIVAFEKEEAVDQRLILSEGPFTTDKILNILKKDFKQLELPTLDESKKINWDSTESIINNEKTKKILGFKFIDLEQSVDDTVAQILND
ncbi:GRP2 [Candida oxycetoniae]|uniref:GRP2 n=1 Tax=Candida oxycetoniae TaxID=497107 RepID=A0AAI9SZX8_9ASCO|nr:GRP2 [Candida oxycetoniae]KAI3406291.1 GRP2 [Candida oxycetoniae]